MKFGSTTEPINFTDPLGYVIHCHNLEHEDHDMMLQWKVVP